MEKSIIAAGFIIIVSLLFGYLIGSAVGFGQGIDSSNRIKCESEFFGEPLSNVNTECLKYFE